MRSGDMPAKQPSQRDGTEPVVNSPIRERVSSLIVVLISLRIVVASGNSLGYQWKSCFIGMSVVVLLKAFMNREHIRKQMTVEAACKFGNHVRPYLKEHSPLGWLICYVLCIPLFGVLFYSIQNEFYQPTVPYQESTKQLLSDIEDDLQESLTTHINYALETDRIADASWLLSKRDGVTVTQIRREDDLFMFTVDISIKSKPLDELNKLPYAVEYFDLARVTTEITMYLPSKGYGGRYEYAIIGADPRLMDATIINPGASRGIRVELHSDIMRVFIPPANKGYPGMFANGRLTNNIHAYYRSLDGFSSGAPNGLGRMLYFSAMTISTMSPGDVSPITTRARVLTLAEGITGILIIGLFLNSIIQSIRD